MSAIHLLTNVQPPIGSETIAEKFQTLFPSVPILIATILAFLFVATFLTYLFYKPVKRAMKKRHDFIQNNIDSAIASNKEAQELKNRVQANLNDSHYKASAIVKDAKAQAERNFQKQFEQAHKDIARQYDLAKKDIAKQQEEFTLAAKQEIVSVASELAKKILKRELSKETEKDILANFDKDLASLKSNS